MKTVFCSYNGLKWSMNVDDGDPSDACRGVSIAVIYSVYSDAV